MASRDIKVFIQDIKSKPPKPFPYIALFHLLAFVLMLLINWGDRITDYYMEVLWLVGFTVSWIYLCDLKKWAAITYIILTLANIATFLYFEYTIDNEFVREGMQAMYVSTLWLPALVFSFLVIFFFRRFNQ